MLIMMLIQYINEKLPLSSAHIEGLNTMRKRDSAHTQKPHVALHFLAIRFGLCRHLPLRCFRTHFLTENSSLQAPLRPDAEPSTTVCEPRMHGG